MLQRARRVVHRARERIRAAAEHDPHAWPDGTVLVLEDGSRAVVDHVEEPHPGDGHHATGAPRHEAAPLAPGSPHPDAPDVDVPGGVSGPPTPGGPPPAPGRDRSRASLLAPESAPRAVQRDVPYGLRVAAAWLVTTG